MTAIAISIDLTPSASALEVLKANGFAFGTPLTFPNTGLAPAVGDLVGLLSGTSITYLRVTERRFVLHPEKPVLALFLDVPPAAST